MSAYETAPAGEWCDDWQPEGRPFLVNNYVTVPTVDGDITLSVFGQRQLDGSVTDLAVLLGGSAFTLGQLDGLVHGIHATAAVARNLTS